MSSYYKAPKIDNGNLKHIKDTKCWDVRIDEHLNWASHIKTTKCKLARGIGILCKARKILKASILLTQYNSFLLPYICYYIEVRTSACIKYISALFEIQKELTGLSTRRPTWLKHHKY